MTERVHVEVMDAPGRRGDMVAGVDTLAKLKDIASNGHRHESYQALVDYHKQHMRGFYRKAMVARWELGHDLLKIRNGAVYGEKTLEKFVEDLGDPAFMVKLAYACAQFAEMFSPEELYESMQYEHVYWGVVTRLMRVKDRNERRKLMKALDSGEIQASKLDEELRKIKSDESDPADVSDSEPGDSAQQDEPSDPSAEPRRNVTKGFRQVTENCALLRKACKQALKDLQNMSLIAGDDEKYDEALEFVADAMEDASATVKLLEEFREEAGRIAPSVPTK